MYLECSASGVLPGAVGCDSVAQAEVGTSHLKGRSTLGFILTAWPPGANMSGVMRPIGSSASAGNLLACALEQGDFRGGGEGKKVEESKKARKHRPQRAW